ncbi:MAG: NfeD family protein [Myxococcota bacterium]
MKRLVRRLVPLGAAAWLVVAAGSANAQINVVTISGSINPASANYLIEAIATSEREQAAALLIELDTPGGLVSSTKDIIQAMLNASVPIVVYVSPRGAWASSAGTFITVAAHVAAMAPGTSIGAASPVSAGGGGGERVPGMGDAEDGDEAQPGSVPSDTAMAKAENFLAAFIESIAEERGRNVEWVVKAVREAEAITSDKALELGVIDLVAENRRDLLEKIEGREVKLAGEVQTLALAGERQVALEMTLLQKIFDFVADPNVAIVLFLAGLLGIYVEVNNPGLIVPGVAGAVCLVLTAIAFQILPFQWVGLLLILVGIGLLIAEVFITSFGALFATGIVCFLLGGTMLFDRPEVSDLNVSFWSVLLPAVLAVAIFGGIVVFSVGRTFTLAQTAGVGELVGLVGRSATRLGPDGKVFVRGEYWSAHCEGGEAAEGEAVEITAVEGLRLRVRKVES